MFATHRTKKVCILRSLVQLHVCDQVLEDSWLHECMCMNSKERCVWIARGQVTQKNNVICILKMRKDSRPWRNMEILGIGIRTIAILVLVGSKDQIS